LFCFLLIVLASAVPALSQNAQTGTVTGRVSAGGGGLPGVTVGFESAALQGRREVVTQTNGDYISPFMPPGLYTVSFSMEGFKTLTVEVKVSTQQVRRLDAQMVDEAFEGEIEIVGTGETISQNISAQTTVPLEFQEKLAVDRSIIDAALLVPGAAGVRGRVSISGGPINDNLWLVNGAVVGWTAYPVPIYIEDAVLETTTSTSGISAEYGRFQGGVVNMLTKFGGNRFSGSFRVNLSNDAWVSRTDLSAEALDEINTVYEATFGGYVLKDALWFFLAGRDTSFSESRTTNYTLIPYSYREGERRREAKLTWSVNQDHRITGSYTEMEIEGSNTEFGTILDLASLNPSTRSENNFLSLNYTGVLSRQFFLEGLYSQRNLTSGIGYGSPYTDIIRGTLLIDRSRGTARYHTPTFCSAPECKPMERDNENWYLKASWFAASESWGTHDLVFGLDRFSDYRLSDSHQSGSDFRIYGSTAILLEDSSAPGGTAIYPVFFPWGDPRHPRGTFYRWTPIFAPPNLADFTTDSIFVNDTWRLNNRWSFNLGIRYDANDAVDGSGSKVADDSRLTPRLGAAWDLKGDGSTILNASYSQYTTLLTGSVADSTSEAGIPAWTLLLYSGPCVNCDAYLNGDHTDLVTQDEAIAIWYEWFQANGGTETLPGFAGGVFPGFTPKILESLDSPYAAEYSIGISQRLGGRGLLRVDFVHRDYESLYISVTEPGRTVDAGYGGVLDLVTKENDDGSLHTRTYDGLHANLQYRMGDRWQIGASWTFSKAEGNIGGTGSGTSGSLSEYPEYVEAEWNAPQGRLEVDVPNRLRTWVIWDAVSTKRHSLSASALFSYRSGASFSKTTNIDTRPFVTNPGYQTPPARVTYFFGGRGSERWNDVTQTDLALNYGFTVGGIQLFAQFDLLNAFNEQAQTGGNTTIRQLREFNPFTEEPVQGVHWDYGPSYGEPTSEEHLQMPRTFRMSLGLRF
jgi:hypothetical protein